MLSFKRFLQEQTAYTPSIDDIKAIWHRINNGVYDDELEEPKFTLEDSLNHLAHPNDEMAKNPDAQILGYCDQVDGKIVLRFSKHINSKFELWQTVGHEMVHQAIAQRSGYDAMLKVGHGPKFKSYQHAYDGFEPKITISKTLD
jgi:hypothetical protein